MIAILKEALDDYNVSVNSIQYSIDDASIIAMVESGLGFGILPELALQNFQVMSCSIPLPSDIFGQLLLVTHNKKPSKHLRHGLLSESLWTI